MFQDLALFDTAVRMARHAGRMQAASAQNIANADTPGYRALRLPDFSDAYASREPSGPRATRPSHLFGVRSDGEADFTRIDAAADPNGNTVSLEQEMVWANTARRDHGRALAIYRSGMTILRTALGGGR
ncbi:FlgB family protein [Roseivivax isoporae]|uniref:Flagellar basal body rod protein FlgB n=1 Tax=Roseivivax isoporae LMG 25204 TaxID=1449351 RepID=X7FA63_9RHOB|nr:FlgB family protein [Roseivivax isoporae]ETX29695.1 flagellar basal body rod protein FlgB [Roseivivax isoporae LMG 25204]